jgi:pyridoxamine 5'-phosphate oxidase
VQEADHNPGYAVFTNYDSRKGQELASNPRIAAVLHWDAMGRWRLEGRSAPPARGK